MKNTSARWWDLPSAALLLGAFLLSGMRLRITAWTPFLYLAQTLSIIGLGLGLALGQSRFSRWTVLMVTAGYTFFLVPWQLTAVVGKSFPLGVQLQFLYGRLFISLSQIMQHQPVQDPLLFIVLAALISWFTATAAGYWLTRHANFLVATVPAGLTMVLVQAYDGYFPSRIWFLALYAFLALILLGRVNYIRNRTSWNNRHLFLYPDTGRNIFNGLLATAAAFTFLAWALPRPFPSVSIAAIYWEHLTRPWRSLREELANVIAPLTSSNGNAGGDFFGEEIMLGGGARIGDEVIFTVRTPLNEERPPRYYWRGRVYDFYAQGEWSSTGETTSDFNPTQGDLPALTSFSSQTNTARFTFKTNLIRQSLLYITSQTKWVSSTGSIDVLDIYPKEPLAWYASPSLNHGDEYQTRARIFNPTISDLQAAGTDYPPWIIQTYLQLPVDFSSDIRGLAEMLTARAQTPYDKAASITEYLRQEIQYNASIPEPPADKDPLVWVLLELKQGYCDYFASAEVLMLRSVGVPARLAVGFSEGNLEIDNAFITYTVLLRDAHAWPEIYFPDIGWIEFEPTGNQPALPRPVNPQSGPILANANPSASVATSVPIQEIPDQTPIAARKATDLFTKPPGGLYLPIIALTLVIMISTLNRRFGVTRRLSLDIERFAERNAQTIPAWLYRWISWTQLTPISRAYETINWSLKKLRKTPGIHTTPARRAEDLALLLPDAAPAIQALVAEHQSSLFSPRPGDKKIARRAGLMIFFQTIRTLLRREPHEKRSLG